MNKNFIKIRIEGQFKNPTNYVWNNVRLIYIDLLRLPNLSNYEKSIIKILQSDFLKLEDAWTSSGIPDQVKTRAIFQNLLLLEKVL